MKNKEVRKIEKIFLSLYKSKLHQFPKVRKKLSVPENQGVYIIYDPQRVVVHVGRTQRAKRGLFQRLQNHLRGRSCFVRKYLKGDGLLLRDGYQFKYFEVSDPRERALAEALAVGKLCPKHLGLGERNKKNENNN